MDKNTLIAMGLTQEQANQILKDLGDNYTPKSDYEGVKAENKQLKENLSERDGQLEELKKNSGSTEELNAQITKLQEENKAKDEAHALEIKQLKINAAIDSALTSAGAKNSKAAKALLDVGEIDKVELDDNGGIKGLSEQIEKLKGAEDSKFLFNDATSNPNKFKGVLPGQNGVEGLDSPADGDYQQRLNEARKNNDTGAVIAIKEAAAAEGVILM